MGGAQAIAVLAFGSEPIERVDVIAGPGQRLRAGGEAPGRGHESGSTASPGPSELAVVADGRARTRS